MTLYEALMDWLFPSQRAALDVAVMEAVENLPAYRDDGLSREDALLNATTGLGLSDVDKRLGARPALAPWLQTSELRALFAQSGLAYRICRAPAYAAMRAGFRLDRGGERNVEAEFLRRLRVRQKFQDAAVMARLYGGAHVLKVTKNLGDLSLPAKPGSEIVALHVITANEANVYSMDSNIESDNWGNPEFYTLIIARDGLTIPQQLTQKVHYSHLIYFPGAFAPHDMTTQRRGYDVSVLDLYFEALRDLDAGQSTLAALLLEQGTPTLALANHVSAAGGSDRNGYALAIKAFMKSRSTHRMGVMSKEDQLVRDAIPLSGTREVVVTLQERVCCVEGIPMTVLWGQPPAGMTSDDKSATRNWHSLLTDTRQDVYEPAIRDLLVHQFGLGADEAISIYWPPLEILSDAERAEVDYKRAQRDKILIDAKVVTREEVRARYQDSEVQEYPLVEEGMPDELVGPSDEEIAAMADAQAGLAGGEGGSVGDDPSRGAASSVA